MKEIELVLAGIGIVGSILGVTKIMLNGIVKTIKEHCATQQNACLRERGCITENAKELWDRVNNHSHKGLDSNGGKVVV